MTPPESIEEEDVVVDAPSEKTTKGQPLVFLAWVGVALTLAFAVFLPPASKMEGWILAGVAALCLLCSGAAWLGARGPASGQRAMSPALAGVAALGLLVYFLMGIVSREKSERSFIQAGNESNLSHLEIMLENYYGRTREYPASLSDLNEEALNLSDSPIEYFLHYVDTQTREEKPWSYERPSAQAFTIKSEPYQFEGRSLTLVLRGTEGIIAREDQNGD